MTILSIESSCDETSAAIIKINSQSLLTVKSNIVASSLDLHAKTGGIIPEVAAREQIKFILPVVKEALEKGINYSLDKNPQPPEIDAIAVTYGPGLIGSLLVGVETAKTLSLLWNKPLIPVNHLYGHIYANFLNNPEIIFPLLALVVSGNHTELVLVKEHNKLSVLGGTRDDAAGEAFDKIGRLLGLSYPAGATISRLAKQGNHKAFSLPRPMIGSGDFDFSFSGLKTAVLNLVKKNNWDFSEPTFAEKNQQLLFDLCASTEEAIIDVLAKKTLKAAQSYDVKSILLGGGVAANDKLKQRLEQMTNDQMPTTNLFVPPPDLCTDNAAMIGAAASFSKAKPWEEITANPQLYF